MMKSFKTPVLLALGLALVGSTAALAESQGNGHTYVLKDGTVHDNPGEMFQHLRTRNNGLATGNPKDIVEAYPDEFDNVGDLIHQRRVDE